MPRRLEQPLGPPALRLAVEDAFRTTKSLLATGPIFHKTDAVIRGHVSYTFLALVLRKKLIDRLAKRRAKSLAWQRILDDLADLSEIEVEQDSRRALLLTAPGPFDRPCMPRCRHHALVNLCRNQIGIH